MFQVRLEAVHVRKKIGAWEIVFLQSPISSHKTLRGHATKKMNRKGELHTSRISRIFRIWQSYFRVPQILKLLCVWYTWKYVARLGFEPLKFLYCTLNYCTILKLYFICLVSYTQLYILIINICNIYICNIKNILLNIIYKFLV